jgi:metallo-beta-lactamase superfamily protein
MSNDIHEVYAVCYVTHARKRSENYIFGDPHDGMTSIAYYVWVIKGPHGTFVCDTGFDEAAAKERSRTIIHPVGEGLKALGVQPDKIDHVIATRIGTMPETTTCSPTRAITSRTPRWPMPPPLHARTRELIQRVGDTRYT